jgi:hypothetical protein
MKSIIVVLFIALSAVSCFAGSSNITFQWNPPVEEYVTETRIYQSSTSGVYGSTPAVSIAQPTNQGTVSNIPDGTYYFIAKFANPAGEGPSSVEIKAVCKTAITSRPEGFNVKEVTTNP